MLIAEQKECSRCHTPTAIDDFPTRCTFCKGCHAQHVREYSKGLYQDDPQYAQKIRERNRAWKLANPNKAKRANLYKYNISLEEYDSLLNSQDGRCATCSRLFDDLIRACIDHNHACCPGQRSCGKCIRGLLCNPCNRALGNINDALPVLKQMIVYLEERQYG